MLSFITCAITGIIIFQHNFYAGYVSYFSLWEHVHVHVRPMLHILNFNCKLSQFLLKALPFQALKPFLKVTVQLETEGNGQNEIVSHMDRLEVKV